jgi:hypothetical protein
LDIFSELARALLQVSLKSCFGNIRNRIITGAQLRIDASVTSEY